MNVNLNNITANTTIATQAAMAAADADKAKASELGSYDLTITLAETAAEDIKAAEIPECALRRDDDLGKLVSAAFSLAPPPFPNV